MSVPKPSRELQIDTLWSARVQFKFTPLSPTHPSFPPQAHLHSGFGERKRQLTFPLPILLPEASHLETYKGNRDDKEWDTIQGLRE